MAQPEAEQPVVHSAAKGNAVIANSATLRALFGWR